MAMLHFRCNPIILTKQTLKLKKLEMMNDYILQGKEDTI